MKNLSQGQTRGQEYQFVRSVAGISTRTKLLAVFGDDLNSIRLEDQLMEEEEGEGEGEEEEKQQIIEEEQ